MSDVIFGITVFLLVVEILSVIAITIYVINSKDKIVINVLSIIYLLIIFLGIFVTLCFIFFNGYKNLLFNITLKEIVGGTTERIHITFFIGVVAIIITFIICLALSFYFLLKVMYKQCEDVSRKEYFNEKFGKINEVEDKTKNKEKKDKQSIRTLNIKGVINVKENSTIPVSDEERSEG